MRPGGGMGAVCGGVRDRSGAGSMVSGGRMRHGFGGGERTRGEITTIGCCDGSGARKRAYGTTVREWWIASGSICRRCYRCIPPW